MSRLNDFLVGVKVLDLSQYIPGPMAGLFLGDMGADVVKVEPPQGDEMSGLGPRDAQGGPVFYRALNAGKTVRRMNLKDSATREEFIALTRDFDILIEGFRPGVTSRLGVDYAALNRVNPGLIYCSMSGFGARASSTGLAAHDGNFMAASGLLDRNGVKPRFFDPPLSDTCGALFAALAILGALHEQRRTGRGSHIDLGLADVMMPLQLMQIADYGANGHIPKSDATYLNGGAAYYQIYGTRDDRHVMLGSLEAKFWRAFCESADRPDWIARQGEPIPQRALMQEVAAFFASATLAETLARFANTDCCLSPVLNLGEAVTSEHSLSRKLVRASEDTGELQALFPAYVDGEPPRSRAAITTPRPVCGAPIGSGQ
jgi:crotonobetainyl-CoA:carnitine CoA-transferase CaiB-like acyl-CoA transferase